MKTTRRVWIPSVCLIALAVFLLLPASALAAEEGGGGGALHLIGRIFNVAVVVGVLVWAGRKPLAEFFKERTLSIREQLDEAQRARQDAEARLAEMQARMRNLDEELKEIRSTSERDAEAEYQRLVSEAERDAEKIIARARQEIDGMVRAARIELKAHAAELSVRLAEERIREEITDQDRERLFGQFVRQLGGKG